MAPVAGSSRNVTCEPHGVFSFNVRATAAPSYFTMTEIPVDRPLTSNDLMLIANDPNNNGNLSVLFHPDPDSCAAGYTGRLPGGQPVRLCGRRHDPGP